MVLRFQFARNWFYGFFRCWISQMKPWVRFGANSRLSLLDRRSRNEFSKLNA
jgi:hypothetical protein